jgi:hypothetical protein
VAWYDESEGHSVVAASTGLTYLAEHVPREKAKLHAASILATKSDDSWCTGTAEILAMVDAERFRKETTPLERYDKDNSEARIRELESKEIAHLIYMGIYPNRVPFERVEPGLAERLRDNLDVLCSLDRKSSPRQERDDTKPLVAAAQTRIKM